MPEEVIGRKARGSRTRPSLFILPAAQVADFNLSRALQGEMVPNSGAMHSLEWAAPEKLSGQRQYNGRAADVFR